MKSFHFWVFFCLIVIFFNGESRADSCFRQGMLDWVRGVLEEAFQLSAT